MERAQQPALSKTFTRRLAVRGCGYMGTIAVRYGDVDEKPSLTTPDAIEINDYLSKNGKSRYEERFHGSELSRTCA